MGEQRGERNRHKRHSAHTRSQQDIAAQFKPPGKPAWVDHEFAAEVARDARRDGGKCAGKCNAQRSIERIAAHEGEHNRQCARRGPERGPLDKLLDIGGCVLSSLGTLGCRIPYRRNAPAVTGP